MLFNSLQYAIFLPTIFILYWLMPDKYRKYLLLLSSYIFYMMFDIRCTILIIIVTFISWLTGIRIGKVESKRKQKITLISSITFLFVILGIFMYYNFLLENILKLISTSEWNGNKLFLNIILPAGISFYTFQCVSYILDVYRGKEEVEKSLVYFALYVAFFPQLIAGPIERSGNVLPQLKSIKKFDYDQATYGLKKMAVGYFKKIVLADFLAIYVNKIYGSLLEYTGFALVIVMVFFTFQIYFDFSGYSDIAIGTAKLFGINLMENFKCPYFATSLKEFWSRWHISLSTWFRDYVYIPLGGGRCGKVKKARNLIITFLLSGLWHGAAWHFVLWGGIHGAGQVIENQLQLRKRRCFGKIISWIIVFGFVNIAWVFFRAESVQDALYVLKNMMVGIGSPYEWMKAGYIDVDMNIYQWIGLYIGLLFMGVYDFLSLKKDVLSELSELNPIIRWGIYIVFIIALLLFSQKGVETEFVYFQF